MELQKVCLKIPTVGSVDLDAVQKAFTAWIRNDSLPGILIDVADYNHMVNGPGTVLVAHEYIMSLDHQDGVSGLRVSGRLSSNKPLASRVAESLDLLKKAAALLKEEIGLALDGSKLEVSVLDRLNADEKTPELLISALEAAVVGHKFSKRNNHRESRRLPGLELAIEPALQV